MRREVYSSVSAVGRSMCVSGASSSESCGSGESGRSAKSGTCFSRTMRSLFGTTTGGISMRIGSWSSKTFFASSTFSSRSCGGELALLAVAARLDARAHARRRPTRCPRRRARPRAATTSPVKRLKAAGDQREQQQRAAGEAERASRRSAASTRAERAARERSGSAAREAVQAQRLERAAREASSSAKPTSETASVRRFERSPTPRRGGRAAGCRSSASATHHHADRPKR